MSARPLLRFTSGPLQAAIDKNVERRLKRFVQDAESEPVALFSPEARAASHGGDWYGEHIGKWLVAANKAVARTGDPELSTAIETVVDALAAWQEPDGWLGTYPVGSPARFTSADVAGQRTWDVWVHAWLVLGLLETGIPRAQTMAERIGGLVAATFRDGKHLVQQGNHAGLSSLVMVEPLARLAQATGERRYADLALAELQAAEQAGLPLLSARTGSDVSKIGTGKAYQILWCLVGMLEVGQVLEDDSIVTAVQALYDDVREHHLSPAGGPWGGIATHNEVFNPRGFFSPTGFVETCSSTSWLDLSLRLYRLTGEAAYADEAEKTLLNAVLGAQDANGEDWCYFTFANGRRNNTYHWACCKSSGALALELGAEMATDGLTVNLLQPFDAQLPGGQSLCLSSPQEGQYVLESDQPMTIQVRVPAWGKVGDSVVVRDGHIQADLQPGQSFTFECRARVGVHRRAHTVDHHGQEVVREEYVCFSRGPYVLAAGPEGDIHTPPTLRLSRLFPMNHVDEAGGEVELRPAGGRPISLQPYCRAGGPHDGAWRNTWFPVAWQ
ncbi:MAG: glycoside hydrolase family 127 protein [Armatimonadetes bacterium]|nr:glycoside hydrolase family 127 protein [Armatimonadota bacterium]